MELRFNFTALWKIAEQLGAESKSLTIPRQSIKIQHQGFTFTGIGGTEIGDKPGQVNISPNGTFSLNGNQVIIYIYDHSFNFHQVMAKEKEGNKYHIYNCQTIIQMKERRRYQRYIATNDHSGHFPIGGVVDGETVKGHADLIVCMNCLNELNYNEAKTQNKARVIRHNFGIKRFFDKYSTKFYNTSTEQYGVNYTPDWREVSETIKSNANWTCYECQVNLTAHKRLLHVHHINGIKSDNSIVNLQPLCADCHRREPNHTHMPRLSVIDSQRLLNSRKTQGLLKREWGSVLKNCELADRDFLAMVKALGFTAPELGYCITMDKASLVDFAWPEQKMAIYTLNNPVHNTDWTVWQSCEFLAKHRKALS